MGTGYCANFADTIAEKVVEEICPKEHKAFVQLLKDNEVSLDLFAQSVQYGGSINDFLHDGDKEICGDTEDKINEAYTALVEAFNAKTKDSGLNLSYHDSTDRGDRYDDVDGAYWDVVNCYQLSPAGKFLKDKGLERKFFVAFG